MWRVGTRTAAHRRSALAAAALAALALIAGGCEPAPVTVPVPPTASPSPSPSPTDAPRRVATPTPPSGAGAFTCTERVTIPDIADVIGAAWSPDGRTIAIDRVVALPSARITGSPEEFFLDAFDIATGEGAPLAGGGRPPVSALGR